MDLFPYSGGELTGAALAGLGRETELTIRRSILQDDLDIYDLEVIANIIDQIPLQPEADEAGDEGRLLQLDEATEEAPEVPTLKVLFDVFITFRSATADHDVEGWVFQTWEEESDRATFVANLKRRSSVFQTVEDVAVTVEGYVPPPPNGGIGPDQPPNEKSNVAVIAGATVGGAALLLLGIFLFMRMSSDRSIVDEDGNPHQSQTTPSTTGQPKVAVST